MLLFREALFKESGPSTGIARRGEGEGGFNPCPNIFEHFLWSSIFGQNAKRGGGVKAMPKDLEHFKSFFYIVEFY